MLKLYFHGSANPNKIALLLYEADLPHEIVPLDGMKGEQHTPEFRAINPNGKLPAIDDDGVTVFDSAAILLYLAEKTGKFLPPAGGQNRANLLSWLAWSVSGISVYTGQLLHFRAFARDSEGTYALRRFEYEAERHWNVLEAQLAKTEFVVGDSYTVADMAMWGYIRMLPLIFGFDGWERYPNIKRLNDFINARPAAAKVIALGESLRDHFSEQMDADAIKHLFAYAQPGDLNYN